MTEHHKIHVPGPQNGIAAFKLLPQYVQVLIMLAGAAGVGAAAMGFYGLPDSVKDHEARIEALEDATRALTRTVILQTCLEIAGAAENPETARHQCVANYGLAPPRTLVP